MSDGRWRRVHCNRWLGGPVRSLSDAERVVWLYCTTGPQSTSVGIYRLSTAVAIEELGNLSAEEFDQRFTAVAAALGWQFDDAVRVLWIPGWLEDNPPQSPNVVISWRKLIGNVPDCRVKVDAVTAIQAFLKDWPEAFRKPFERYRVSLPEGFVQHKAKPKANQGSGIRDSGIQGEREHAKSGIEGSAALLNARRTLTFTSSRTLNEDLIETFFHVARSGNGNGATNFTKTQAIEALNTALSEQRSA